jgi:hypothetical protein
MRTEQVKVASKAELKAFFGSVIELLVAKGFGDVLSQVMKMDLSKIGDLRGNAILVTAMLDRIDERFGDGGWRKALTDGKTQEL